MRPQGLAGWFLNGLQGSLSYSWWMDVKKYDKICQNIGIS
jgi:hypothetical protein